jgi:hypothetical protein
MRRWLREELALANGRVVLRMDVATCNALSYWL